MGVHVCWVPGHVDGGLGLGLEVLLGVRGNPLVVLHNGARCRDPGGVDTLQVQHLLSPLLHGPSAHEEGDHGHTETNKSASDHDKDI